MTIPPFSEPAEYTAYLAFFLCVVRFLSSVFVVVLGFPFSARGSSHKRAKSGQHYFLSLFGLRPPAASDGASQNLDAVLASPVASRTMNGPAIVSNSFAVARRGSRTRPCDIVLLLDALHW